MSNLENKTENDDKIEDEVEIEDILTPEEQQKIESIQDVSFITKKEQPIKKEEAKPFSIWSFFGINSIDVATALGGAKTRQTPQFDIQRMVGLNKVVTINNISGKPAYVILTSSPIKTVSSFGLGTGILGPEVSANIAFEEKGEYKSQKLSIANNTRSEYELDNNKFYCTLFLYIDSQWKKSWDNRRFNGRRYDINILEKHVSAALNKNDIPDF